MKNKIHHVGIVVSSIPEAYKEYFDLGYTVLPGFESPQVDNNQRVFVGVVQAENTLIEFVSPVDEKSPVSALAKKGGGVHHICLSCNNLETQIEKMKKKNIRQLTPITISVWNQQRVVFFLLKSGAVVEYLEEQNNE